MQLAAEVKNDGSVSEFVFATSVNSADYMKQGTSHYRLIHDHLGSPRLVVNSLDGTIMQRLDYNEWGNVIADSNPNFQPYGFAGGLYDSDTKLTKFGARDYSASVARWNSKDPILFAGGDTNLYRYVIGDPINLIDYDGKSYSEVVKAVIKKIIKGFVSGKVRKKILEFIEQADPFSFPEIGKDSDKVPGPLTDDRSGCGIYRSCELEKKKNRCGN